MVLVSPALVEGDKRERMPFSLNGFSKKLDEGRF